MKIILIGQVAGASEARGAGNPTMNFLHLSYIAIAREAGMIKFTEPFVLQIDNDAACIFDNGTCFRSHMKHIGCRHCSCQEWVRILDLCDIYSWLRL